MEVVAPLGRGTPRGLAGGLAGLAAGRLGTVPLVPAVTRVGFVQLAAVAALTSSVGCHHAPKVGSPKLRQRGRRLLKKTKEKKTIGKKTQIRRRRFVEGQEEDTAEEDAIFKSATLGYFRNGVDTACD